MTDSELNIFALLSDTMRYKVISARKQAKMSVSDLAKCCGWNEEYLIQIEKGEREITPEILAKVLDAVRYFQV